MCGRDPYAMFESFPDSEGIKTASSRSRFESFPDSEGIKTHRVIHAPMLNPDSEGIKTPLLLPDRDGSLP